MDWLYAIITFGGLFAITIAAIALSARRALWSGNHKTWGGRNLHAGSIWGLSDGHDNPPDEWKP